jgi:hypothetical protein
LIKYSIVELTLESKENADKQSVTVRVMDLVRETPAFVKVMSRVKVPASALSVVST